MDARPRPSANRRCIAILRGCGEAGGNTADALILQRHMIMYYPEYSKVVSRLRCPRLAVADTFVLYGIFLLADCGAGDTELSRWRRCKPVIEPMVGNSELLSMLMPQSEPALPSDTNCLEFFSLRL